MAYYDKEIQTYEDKQAKLKSIREKFLNKNKEVSKNTPNDTETKEKIIFNKTKPNKDEKQQLNNVNKKIEELREREKKYKDNIFKLKTNLSNLKDELYQEKDSNIKLSDKLNKYQLKINQLESEVENLEKSFGKESVNFLLNRIYTKDEILKDKTKKILDLQNHIKNLNVGIQKYKEDNFRLTHNEDLTRKSVSDYRETITKYAIENAKLRKQLLEIEQNYKSKFLKLSNTTFEKNIALSVKRGSRNNKKRKFGTLKTINSIVFFQDVDGNKYIANIDGVKFKENAPCKAVIRYNKNNIALIQEVYDEKDDFIKKVKKIKTIEKNIERKEFLYEDVDYKSKFNILIIGSENKEQYLNSLWKIGLNAKWYDSYEGNIVRLRNMLDRNDVIICCVRHARHYASNLMTYMIEHDREHAIKYNIIDSDSVENIIARVRYCIENL